MRIWRRRRSWLAAAMAGVLLAAGATAVAVTAGEKPARAACSGAGCNGKYPDIEGCAGGSVLLDSLYVEWIQNEPEVEGTVMLRYSARCRAGFAELNMRVALAESFYPVFWYQPQYGGRMTPLSTMSNGTPFRMASGDGVPGNANHEVFYSAMINWDVSVRVCVDEASEPHIEPDRPRLPSTALNECLGWQ